MTLIASTARILSPNGLLRLGSSVNVGDFAILGQPNQIPGVCSTDEERRISIDDGTIVGPYTLIYEGAQLGKRVSIDPRCIVGSHTVIGDDTRLLYGAQVHDHIQIGARTFIRGFICDNSTIGNDCYVFGDFIHELKKPAYDAWDATDEQGPSIEDNVLIGWGAVLIGPITIGRGARVYPHAVVRRDIKAGAIYGGDASTHH